MKGPKKAEDGETRGTEIALFRYGLLAPILHRELERGELLAYLRQVAGDHHQVPYSSRTTVGFTTLWRWLVAYRREGFEGLKPHSRRDQGSPRRVPREVLQRAILLRQEVPSRSSTTIAQILARDHSLPTVKASRLWRPPPGRPGLWTGPRRPHAPAPGRGGEEVPPGGFARRQVRLRPGPAGGMSPWRSRPGATSPVPPERPCPPGGSWP